MCPLWQNGWRRKTLHLKKEKKTAKKTIASSAYTLVEYLKGQLQRSRKIMSSKACAYLEEKHKH